MRGVVLVALVLFSTPSGAGELPRGLVGFSSATVQGDAGVFGMTAACQADFPTSRMCLTTEVIATQALPALSSSDMGWVQPVLLTGNTGPEGAGTGGALVDAASGHAVPVSGTLSCQSWINAASGIGLVVLSNGGIGTGACDTAHQVACCAAQPQLLGDINQDGNLDLADLVLTRRFLAGETTVVP